MSAEPRRGFFYGWVVLAAASLAILVGFGQQFSFGVFLKPLLSEFGLPRSLTSGPFSAYSLAYGASSIMVGTLSDRYGPRALVVGAGFVMGLGLLLSSRVTSLWQLYMTYGVLAGVGAAALYVALASAVGKWFPTRRGFAMGVLLFGFGIGAVGTPPLANQLTLVYGWRTAFIVLALIVSVVVISCGLLVRLAAEGEVRGVPRAANQAPRRSAATGGGATLRQALAHPSLWMLFVLAISIHWGQFTFLGHVVAYATDRGLSATVGANSVALYGVGSIMGTLGLSVLSDRVGRRPVLAASALAEAAAMFWAIGASTVWSFYVLGLTFGMATGGWRPLMPAMVADLFGMESFGAIFGAQLMAHALGAAIGPVLSGYIFDTTQGYTLGFVIPALFIVLTSALIPFIRPRRR